MENERNVKLTARKVNQSADLESANARRRIILLSARIPFDADRIPTPDHRIVRA